MTTAQETLERAPTAPLESSSKRSGRNAKAASLVVRIAVVFGRGLCLTLGVASILGFCYLFGHGMLETGLGGNDTNWALSLVMWFDRWFPDIPLWYPLQGAGTPLTVFYPPGVTFISILLRRTFVISEAQALALTGFLSIPITAFGIYLLTWVKLRSQTMAWIAGLLYPLSSASWYWLTEMGMFAQAVSMMYFPFALLLFDLYITRSSEKRSGQRDFARQGALLGAAVLFACMFLTHGATSLVFAMTILLHAVIKSVSTASRKSLVSKLFGALRSVLTALLAGLGLVAFWLIPFLRTMSLANRSGLAEFAPHQIPYTDLAAMLGLREPDVSVFSKGLTFAPPVLLLGILGCIYLIRRRNTGVSFVVLAIFFALYTAMPGLLPGLVRPFSGLWAFTQARALVPTIVLLPVIAAGGAGAIPRGLFALFEKARRKLFPRASTASWPNPILSGVRTLLIATLTAAIALTSIVLLEGPARMGIRYSAYGPPVGDPRPHVEFDGEKFVLTDPPQFSLTTVVPESIREYAQPVIDHIPLDSTLRLDNTPSLGGLTQSISLYSEASIVNTYNYQSSIIHAMWGYQQGMFYGMSEAEPHQIDELAKWFGIQYVVLHQTLDDLEKFPLETWPLVYRDETPETGVMEIRRFSAAPQLASLLRSPRILAIGGQKYAIYDEVFRTFVDAALGFEDALLVEGSHNIDDYDLEELMQFDVVLLHGYGYEKRARAWQLLQDYVAQGGALYVDTGWQYRTPDWEMEEAPEVLPFTSLIWTHFGTEAEFALADPGLDLSAETAQFAPLIWNDGPWGVSSPNGELRAWAQPVLTAGGNPIIVAGEYGQGRVVWSGMNLIGHAHAFENTAEKEFFRQLVQWLAPPPATTELDEPAFEREHPDRIRFPIGEPIADGTSLLWREAYSPDWHASIDIGVAHHDVPVYSAGPGMMLLILPASASAGATVDMSFGFGWLGLAGTGISSLTGVVLLSSTVLGGRLPSSTKGRPKVKKRAPKERHVEQPQPKEPTQPSADEAIPDADAEKIEIEEALRSLNAKPETSQGQDQSEQRWAARVLGRPETAKDKGASSGGEGR